MLNFAKCLYILAGRNAYEFVRLNLPGGLPSLFTLKESFSNAKSCIKEGEFRFNLLRNHQNTFGYRIVVRPEDATAVIKNKCLYSSRSLERQMFELLPLARIVMLDIYYPCVSPQDILQDI